jgi:hypothetical protein
MKKLLFLVTVVISLASCKKTYHCTCNTTSTALQNGGYVNQAQYTFKEWNQDAAYNKCMDKYKESDYVVQNNVQSQDMKCEMISPK